MHQSSALVEMAGGAGSEQNKGAMSKKKRAVGIRKRNYWQKRTVEGRGRLSVAVWEANSSLTSHNGNTCAMQAGNNALLDKNNTITKF